MILLTADQVCKSYTEKTLVDHATFGINDGDKIGIIGINGTGKSTLLKLIAGILEPDSGSITLGRGVRVGYLPQNPDFQPGNTVITQAMAGVSPASHDAMEYECRAILTRLGLTNLEQPVEQLSGGQKKKVALACALVSQVDILILDEPTNHIDSDMVEWLEGYLSRYTGALVMITHDRYFLDRVTRRIFELDKGKLYIYEDANYETYLEKKALRKEMTAATERKRQALLKKELAWIQRGARARTTKQQFRVDRFHEMSAQKVELPPDKLELSSISSRLGKQIIEIEDVCKGYEGQTLIDHFSYNVLRDDRIGIVGPNGCGKSTLLGILRGTVQPDAGQVKRGATVQLGCFSQEGEELNPNERPIDYIESIARNVRTPEGVLTASQMLEKFLFDSTLQYTTIGRLSGGERRRLQLLAVLMGAPNILLLDEPTNDLDIETLSILEDYLDTFQGAVITVSHDRYFLDRICTRIFAFQPGGHLAGYMGGYSDYAQAIKQEQAPAQQQSTPRPRTQRVRQEKLKFSYKEEREYETIDQDITALEEKINQLETDMSAAGSNYTRIQELAAQKEEAEAQLSDKMERWVYLNELAEKIEAQKDK